MLYSKIVTDKNSGYSQIQFFLTQGDTAHFTAVPKLSNGETVDLSLISKCMFKLSDDSYKQVFEKEFEVTETGFQITLESEETTAIPVGEYIYEVEYTFVDGSVNTPNQSGFNILEQIVR